MAFNFDIAKEMLEQVRSELDFAEVKPLTKPYLIVLGGQPGSGKSNAIEIIEERFNDNIITLNGDDFKTTYPRYDELLAKDAIKASEEVQLYSNYVVDQLKNDYANKKFNVIIEGTMRTIDVPLSTITEFKEKGYQIEVYVVASNYYARRVGCLYRMEMDIADNGHGRAVPVESHDAAYNNIPKTILSLINSGKLDNLTVISRSGELIATLSNGDDVIAKYEVTRINLRKNEFKEIDNKFCNVINMMHERKAKDQEILKVINLKNQFYSEYSKFFIIENNGAKLWINTNKEVLDYFRKITPELIATVERNGIIEVKGYGSLYLTQESPETLTKLLAKSLNINVKCEHNTSLLNIKNHRDMEHSR